MKGTHPIKTSRWQDIKILKRAFDDSDGNVMIIDLQLMAIVDANNATLTSLGYSKEEFLQLSLEEIDLAYSRDAMQMAFERIVQSSDHHATIPTIHRRKDGTTFEVELYLRCFTKGEDSYILVIATEVSLLKKANEELKFHATLFNNIFDAIVATDESFLITSYNQHAAKLLGWENQDVTGKSIREVTQTVYPDSSTEEVERSLEEKGLWRGEIITKKYDGESFPARISISALKGSNGKITGTIAVVRDTTDEKKSAEKIKYLADLVDKVKDAIISVDKQYTVVSWNKGAEKMYGFTQQEVKGKSIFNLWTRSNIYWRKEQVIHELLECDFWEGELKHYHKDNSEKYTLVSASSLKDHQNAITGFVVVSKDITERKMLERQLEELNTHLEQRVTKKTEEVVNIFERITDGFVALNANSNFTYVNKEAAKIYCKERSELIGRNIWDVFPDAVSHSFFASLNEAMIEQKMVQVEDYYQPLNKWIQGTLYPSPDGISIYFRDVTKSRRTELALKDSEEKYRTIIENVQEGIWQIDENNVTTFVNDYLAKALGYTTDEMIGKSFTEFVGAANYEKGLQNVEDRKRGISTQHELTFVSKGFDSIHMLIHSAPIFKEGTYKGSISTLLDITGQKKASEELADSEQKYRELFENNPLPMLMLEYPARNLVAVNNALIDKFGYTWEEFSTMVITDLRPAGHYYKTFEVERVLAENREFKGRMELQRKNGTIIIADVQIIEIAFHGKTVFLSSIRDITEQVKAEADLKKLNNELRELASHLQDIREEERTNMAREIHDELGQQLTVLKMDLWWLNKRFGTEDEKVKSKIKGALELIDGTINTVRKISSELRPSVLDELGLSEAIEWQTGEFMKRTGIVGIFHSNNPDCKIPADVSTGAFRIFQEALTNVARHAEATEVLVTLNHRSDELHLSISDNGVGFDVSGSQSKTLGLLGIKERIVMLNGQYCITSEPGKGTTISVDIPLTNE
jgi:PAS domain S-box-containing protein